MATFELGSLGVFEIIYHHKAGARGSPRAVNSDYHEGLELLLRGLGGIGVSILGISIDSQVARRVDSERRELELPFPIDVDSDTEVAGLRLKITRAQRSVARRDGAKPGGGNDQKTIRMTIACHSPHIDYEHLVRLLVGRSESAARRAEGPPITGGAGE